MLSLCVLTYYCYILPYINTIKQKKYHDFEMMMLEMQKVLIHNLLVDLY